MAPKVGEMDVPGYRWATDLSWWGSSRVKLRHELPGIRFHILPFKRRYTKTTLCGITYIKPYHAYGLTLDNIRGDTSTCIECRHALAQRILDDHLGGTR